MSMKKTMVVFIDKNKTGMGLSPILKKAMKNSISLSLAITY